MQRDASVQCMEGKCGPAAARAAAEGSVAAVNDLALTQIAGRGAWTRSYFEVRVNSPVEPLESQVGVQSRLEVDVDGSVERIEGCLLGRILRISDLQLAIERMDLPLPPPPPHPNPPI